CLERRVALALELPKRPLCGVPHEHASMRSDGPVAPIRRLGGASPSREATENRRSQRLHGKRPLAHRQEPRLARDDGLHAARANAEWMRGHMSRAPLRSVSRSEERKRDLVSVAFDAGEAEAIREA